MDKKPERIKGEELKELLRVLTEIDEKYSEKRGHYFRVDIDTPEGKRTYGFDYENPHKLVDPRKLTNRQLEGIMPLEREDEFEDKPPPIKKLFADGNIWVLKTAPEEYIKEYLQRKSTQEK